MSDAAAPAFSMGKDKRGVESRKDRDFKQVGPGSYSLSLADKKKEPAFSMGAKVQTENTKLSVPGAGAYEIPSRIQESPGKTMSSRYELKDLTGKLGPGPGGYSVDKAKKQNFAFSMGSKLENLDFKKQNYKPGPGTHNPNKRVDIPSMKFGSGQRSSLDGKTVSPGPGGYAVDPSRTQKSAPRFGFGTSTRNEAGTKLKVPGPGNYASKTFTGKDMPSYSMGAQSAYSPERKEQAYKPGPGNYSPGQGIVKKQEPSFKIGTEVRRDLAFEKAQLFQTSPGQYDPKPETTKLKAAGWRIGTENRPGMVQKGQKFVPGAGEYSLPSKISEGPKIGMHAKTDTVDQNVKKAVPGPGQYNLQNSPGQKNTRAPAYSLGSGSRIDLSNSKQSKFVPGPGNYSTSNDMKRTAPRYGFGSEKRPEVAKTGKFATPAPGSYNARNSMGKDGPSLTMSPLYHDKFKEKNDKLVPGPGQYEFHGKAMKTAPNWGFGTSQRAEARLGSKNVNTEIKYMPEHNMTKSKSPNYRFGSDTRKMFDDKKSKAIPAPGNYTIKSAAFEDKSRFHMGVKLQDQKKLEVPGSGTYNPSETFTKKTSANYSMGIKLKGSLTQSVTVVPGPGQYAQDTEKLRNAAPKFGFGSSKRPDITGGKKLQTPGPGNYKLPSKIGNVSDFQMPGRDQQSKYV